jgi:hypothetical protein
VTLRNRMHAGLTRDLNCAQWIVHVAVSGV